MSRFQTLLRRVLVLATALSMNLMIVADAWAKKTATSPGSGSSSTGRAVIGYILVVLLIALGLLVACRPAKRASGIEDVTGKSFLPSFFGKKKDGESSS
ncbi:MAG: hypothetical protein IIA67_05090 [Planctomycetes bacterium]|nr:hypothetical protein [Planctomycetota bacterium]